MEFKKLLRRFGGEKSGAIAIWAALSMPMVLGISALAFDMNNMYATKAQLQHTADASALAAAIALPDQSTAASIAQSYAQLNMAPATHGNVVNSNDVVTGNWDSASRTFTPSGTPVNAVQVSARRSTQNGNPMATNFANALGFGSVDVSTSSIAVKRDPGLLGTCILALNMTVEEAFHLYGTADVLTNDCDIQVNSNDDEALVATGQTLVKITGVTGQIRVVGEVEEKGPASFDPTPLEGQAPIDDPYEALAFPTVGSCTETNYSKTGDDTPAPGVYCGGMQFTGTGTVTFEGAYIINGGELHVGGNIIADTGSGGVTFFLTGGATVKFIGTADIGLTAPSSGTPHDGFILFGDKSSPPLSSDYHNIRGTSLGGYNGRIYLPLAKVNMGGTANGTLGSSDCTVIVADTFEFGGTPLFEAIGGCSDFPPIPIVGGGAILVN